MVIKKLIIRYFSHTFCYIFIIKYILNITKNLEKIKKAQKKILLLIFIHIEHIFLTWEKDIQPPNV